MRLHIAIIPDGNRRYAAKRGITYVEAYREGMDKAEEVLDWLSERADVGYVTLFALSTDNISKRGREEVDALFRLISSKLDELAHSEKVHSRNVRVRVIGRRAVLPPYLIESVERVEAATAGYSGLSLNIALGYGGRDEIIDAVNRALSIGVSRLDEGEFRRLLYLDGVPDPDILIRTGGEKRISNFLLFYISYTELFFLDKYWPELTRDDIAHILDEFYRRQRRYGK